MLSSFQCPHSLFPSRLVFSPTLNVDNVLHTEHDSFVSRSFHLRSIQQNESPRDDIYFLLSDENITRIRGWSSSNGRRRPRPTDVELSRKEEEEEEEAEEEEEEKEEEEEIV